MSGRPRRRLAAILAADVAGYSRLIGADEEGALMALRAHRVGLIEPLLQDHGGRIANTAGDSLLIEFSSAVDAVRFALAMQQGLATRDADVADEQRIRFRVGINIGDVVVDGNDLLGDGVNVAARLEALAEPGGIAVSDDAYRHVRGRVDAGWTDTGERTLKNIAEPVRVWTWTRERGGTIQPVAAPADAPLMVRGKPSIAVLPFENMSGESDQGYFADGITEDIITGISKIPALLVIARNSTFTYKGKTTKVQDICRELEVRYVLEGSVRKSGQRVRVTAQLIDGASGAHVWAERYDRELADIFAVQDDITAKIVHALEINIFDANRALPSRMETDNPEAYDCVLRGREQYRLFSRSGNAIARELYERATVLDPDYAEPYAGLAETYVQDWFMGSEPALDRAFEFARQATAHDPTLPLVQEALSTVYLFKRQHAEAIATARRWIELEPSNADAYATLAGAMHFSGENDEVIALIKKAMRLNPFYPFYYPHYIGLANLGMRRFDDAVVALRRSIVRNPDALWPHVFLAVCGGHLGEDVQGRAQLAEVRRISPDFSVASVHNLLPYKSSADVDLVVEGLRKAGLST